MKKNFTFKACLSALFATMALLSFMLESLVPPIIIPGARLGVSNVFVLLSTITLGAPFGVAVLVIKCVLGSIFAGNPSTIFYSLPAGAIALTFEILLLLFAKRISVVSISVAGGVINNVAQNTVFCLVTKTYEYFLYLPYLALIGALSGAIIGFIVYLLVKKLPTKLFSLESENTTNCDKEK